VAFGGAYTPPSQRVHPNLARASADMLAFQRVPISDTQRMLQEVDKMQRSLLLLQDVLL
jgi:hypothetical protein